jgi:hypothetical protein
MAQYIISTGELIDIKKGDWVEVQSGLFPLDPKNGSKFEVSDELNQFVQILVKLDGEAYSAIILSPSYINGNYRKVSNEE